MNTKRYYNLAQKSTGLYYYGLRSERPFRKDGKTRRLTGPYYPEIVWTEYRHYKSLADIQHDIHNIVSSKLLEPLVLTSFEVHEDVVDNNVDLDKMIDNISMKLLMRKLKNG